MSKASKYIWAALALFILGVLGGALREIPELGMAGSVPRVIAQMLGYVGAGYYLAKSNVTPDEG